MPAKQNGLTEAQEKFIQNIISGMTQRQAYIDAYPNTAAWKPESVDNKASKLFQTTEVKARYEELIAPYREKHLAEQEATAKKTFLTLERKHELLMQFAEDSNAKLSERMQAIDLDNKMLSLYTTKQEFSVSRSSKLDDIFRQLAGDAEAIE